MDIAVAIRAVPELAALERARDAGAAIDQELAARARVDEAVTAAQLEVEATTSELECELRFIDHASDIQQEDDEDLNRTLTAVSLGVAAATAIAGSALIPVEDTESAQATIGITGGAAAGAVGLAQLFVEVDAEVRHRHSALADLWAMPATPAAITPVVYAFLTRPQHGQRTTHRDRLVEGWLREERLGDDPTERARLAALFFGDGGTYTSDELRNRRHMINDVKVVVWSMSAEIRSLAREVASYRVVHRASFP